MEDHEEMKPGDIFRILVATDIHLGYGESNPIRENDTFVTFEEILQIAGRENVDFILLGGDLFHETRPSPHCLTKCTELIRRYCLGDRPVEIEFLSDPSYNFRHSSNPTVNYEDPNLNVSMPIFSIHGNHDDPTGRKQTSAMDLLSSMGLVNYFGRWNDLTKVEIDPILLRKGASKLALYGLSHIKDARLARLFLDKKVVMKRPEEEEDDWFNLLVWHQNRADRGVKNFIAESVLPDFLDLVVWGHEHDCRIEPMISSGGNVYISQPGSSVATSLSPGEAVPKNVGLLKVAGKSFELTPIELRTVRPFVYGELLLDMRRDAAADPNSYHQDAMAQVLAKVNGMIEEAKRLGKSVDLLPLIRLSVRYRDERQVFNAITFGQKYAGKVANPADILKFSALRKAPRHKPGLSKDDVDLDGELDFEKISRVEDVVSKYFTGQNKLDILSLAGLNEAVKKFIDSNDTDAPVDLIEYQQKETLRQMEEMQPDENEVEQFLERLRTAREGKELEEVHKVLNDPARSKTRRVVADEITIEDSDEESPSTSRPAKGPGSRGGRGARAGRGTRGPRGGRGQAKIAF